MNVEKEMKTYTIDNSFFDTFTTDQNTEIFTIYVNRPFDIPTLHSLHKISSYTVMADGAVNRFHDRFTSRYQDKEIIPNAIIGDFDSIREDVLEYYKGKGVMVGQNPSQDNSDLEKCLIHLDERLQSISLEERRFKSYRIVVAGGLGGRLDHTLNNIHLVHKYSKKYSQENLDVCLMLLDNNSIGTCILPGKTKYIRSKVFEKEKGCGFFPFLGEVQGLVTKGLRWNVDGSCNPLNFEKFISSSNEIVEDIVEFEANKTIFWTTTNQLNDENFEY